MACKVCLWFCLALLYKKTPMNTRTVPMALRMVIWLLNTIMLSQIDRACLTVLATLRKRCGLLLLAVTSNQYNLWAAHSHCKLLSHSSNRVHIMGIY